MLFGEGLEYLKGDVVDEFKTTNAGLIDRFTAARWLGISLRKLDDLVSQRLIPSIKLGRRRLFDPEQLRVWLQRQHEQAGVA